MLSRGAAPVLLLDDLASELDPVHRDRVLGKALEMGLQTWVTSTQKSITDAARPASMKLFHVEHGRVLEMV